MFLPLPQLHFPDPNRQKANMEYLATTTIPDSAEYLQHRLTIAEFPRWCASIEKGAQL
jgi:hypothetical protein